MFAIGIQDLSLLSGSVDEEFKMIKRAYFQKMLLCNHPDRSPRVFSCTRVAFEVLRCMFHRLRAKHSSFSKFLTAQQDSSAGDLHYINDMHSQFKNVVHSCHPSYEHFAMAATQENPTICVSLSSACRQCEKCKKTIPIGDLEVGVFSDKGYDQWQHMRCWDVPIEIWLGLSQPHLSLPTLRDMASMDEVFLTGFSTLDHASQLEFTRYIMNNQNWIIARADAGLTASHRTRFVDLNGPGGATYSRGEQEVVVSSPGNENAGQKRFPVSEVDDPTRNPLAARPLKKRSVLAESGAAGKQSNLKIEL